MASVPARADYIDHFYETSFISSYLDYLLVLSFDMRSSREKKTRITSALFPKLSETGIESTLNQVFFYLFHDNFNLYQNEKKIYNRKAAAVAKWITEGCKPEKIVVGIAGKLKNGFRNLIKININ